MAIKIVDGITRKVAIGFIGLSFAGWIAFLGGFGAQQSRFKHLDSNYKPDDSNLYYQWAAVVVGPVVYILAVVHAFLWGFPSAIVGSVTAALSMMYITAMGAVLVSTGININDYDSFFTFDSVLKAANSAQFAGAFVSTFFWTFVLGLWPWYKIDTEGQFSGF